jgi:Bacteriophage minor capsid protein
MSLGPVTQQLQHTVDIIIAQLMIQNGVASAVSATGVPAGPWPVYVNLEPSNPDQIIFITETVGSDGGRTMIDGEMMSHFGFQVMVRGYDDKDTPQEAQYLRYWMEAGVNQQTVSLLNSNSVTVNYLIPCISGIGQVLKVGRDRPSTGRYKCTVNAQVAVQVIP